MDQLLVDRPATASLLRPITDEEIETFWRDGVVCLKGVIDKAWLEAIAGPVESILASGRATNVTERVRKARAGGAKDLLQDGEGSGGYYIALDAWRLHRDIGRFATRSMIPEIAARVLRSSAVSMYTDQLLVKEPGAPTRTAFHVDEPYFIAEGEQVCTCWIPLDTVTLASGAMGYVRGSHRWNANFKPNDFATGRAHAHTLSDLSTESLPDIDRNPEKFDIVHYECGPGDMTIHHMRTAHGSGGNTTAGQRRRALAIRYCGDDAVYRAKATIPLDPSAGLVEDGEPFRTCPLFPVVWRE
jgi:ectoine hydroxylase-related dioxygenase (phytanoyl-CoA dioxygenase family)